MGWSNEDGKHEGWAGTLFAYGWIGSGWERGGVSVTRAPDGSFRREERTVRPDVEVIGWVPICECGWRGQKITRVASLDDMDDAARKIYSLNSHLPEGLEDGLVLPQWRAHVTPEDLAVKASRAHLEYVRAGKVLDEAVAAMRAAGASWGDVGRATGMTLQSANERWAKRLAGRAGWVQTGSVAGVRGGLAAAPGRPSLAHRPRRSPARGPGEQSSKLCR